MYVGVVSSLTLPYYTLEQRELADTPEGTLGVKHTNNIRFKYYISSIILGTNVGTFKDDT